MSQSDARIASAITHAASGLPRLAEPEDFPPERIILNPEAAKGYAIFLILAQVARYAC